MDDCRSCAAVVERMTRYVDGTLSPQEHAALERHLDACRPCRNRAKQEATARTVLRECANRLRASASPPELRARCTALAHSECHVSIGRWRTALVPALVTASLVVATTGAILWVATQRSMTLLAAQLSADHTRCFGRIPGDAASLDPAQVEQLLASRYGWDVHVPPPAGVDGLRLVEGRRCLMAHGGVPHLLYRINGKDVSLYLFEGARREEADVTSLGHRTLIWSRGANSFALVSSSEADVSRMIDYVRRDAH